MVHVCFVVFTDMLCVSPHAALSPICSPTIQRAPPPSPSPPPHRPRVRTSNRNRQRWRASLTSSWVRSCAWPLGEARPVRVAGGEDVHVDGCGRERPRHERVVERVTHRRPGHEREQHRNDWDRHLRTNETLFGAFSWVFKALETDLVSGTNSVLTPNRRFTESPGSPDQIWTESRRRRCRWRASWPCSSFCSRCAQARRSAGLFRAAGV